MTQMALDALIALAGQAGSPDYFSDWAVQTSKTLIAADGGAEALLTLGHVPRLLVGDFDSIRPQTRRQLAGLSESLTFPRDKDYTDGELAVAAAVLLALGMDPAETALADPQGHALYQAFETAGDLTGRSFIFLDYGGRRLDHQLANVALARILALRGALVFMTDRTSLARLISGPADMKEVFPEDCFRKARDQAPETSFHFSLLALDDGVTDLTLKGLEWELDGLRLPMGRSQGLSNRPRGAYPLDLSLKLSAGSLLAYTYPRDL